MKWQDVFSVHRKIGALYFEGDKLKSVLFSQDRRRTRHNFRRGDLICLCFDKESKSRDVRKMMDQLSIGDSFIVYEKMAPDSWVNAGYYECVEIGEGVDDLNREAIILSMSPVKG